MTTPSKASGFTLVELIVVMAVVAILAAIAIPSYSQYVLRNNRAQAQVVMSQVASLQQQYLLNRRQYGSLADLGATVPADVAAHYNVTVATDLPAVGSPTFTLTATPIGGQASDRCGTMTLDQAGAKTPASGCW